jgi:hypothetical protein
MIRCGDAWCGRGSRSGREAAARQGCRPWPKTPQPRLDRGEEAWQAARPEACEGGARKRQNLSKPSDRTELDFRP